MMPEMEEVRPATKRRRVPPALILWIAGIGVIAGLGQLRDFLAARNQSVALLTLFRFFAWLLVIGLTLYGAAVIIRWILTRLFWTVGRRLFLSYLLVSVLPFFLMAVLLITVAYMFAAVMTQAAVRAERQATLGQLENWALEYATTGRRPTNALKSL